LRNQHLDSKILLILFKSKIPIIVFGLAFFSLIPFAQAEVFVPEDEYVGYFDSNGVYTVIGNVKNELDYAIIPTITVSVIDDSEIFSKTIEHVPLSSDAEIPFKVKFPQVVNPSPILKSPDISYVHTEKIPLDIEVIYDDSLVQYDDGHLTGRIINNGGSTVYNIKVFAIIHGYERVLDMGQNIEMIEKMDPGEIRTFSMYPDPSITEDVYYYSCFAPTDNTVVSMYTERNQEKFYFRYDSGSWYYDARFNEAGTELSMKTQTSFNLETFATFEFPRYSDSEKFTVYLNDEPKEFIQSLDENENWHLSFTVEPFETGNILITGFDEGWDPGEGIIIPDWIKNNAKSWSKNNLDDNIFVNGIEFMIQQEILKISITDNIGNEEIFIPDWIKNIVDWWVEGQVSDDEFVNAIENLIERKIIVI